MLVPAVAMVREGNGVFLDEGNDHGSQLAVTLPIV